MKIRLTLLFFTIVTIGFAQKKEMKQIERAIAKNDFSSAQQIFKTIDENSVEEKYAGTYQFYKAASLMDLTNSKKATLEDLRAAETALLKAKELKFNNAQLEPFLENIIQRRKLDIANEKITSGDSKKALALVEEIYESNPSNLDMLYNAGNLAYSNKMFDKAIEKYDLLLEKKYTGEKTTFLAVNKSGEIENFSNKKIRDYSITAGTHTSPSSETSSSNLGDIVLKTTWLYNNKGETERAKVIFQNALKNHPNDTSLKVVKADVFLTLGMKDEYKKAVESIDDDIKDPKVFYNLGISAFDDKNYESAIKYFKSSLKLVPNDYFTLVNLSNSYLETGNLEKTTAAEQKELYKKAIDYLEKAHEVKPEDKNLMTTLVSLYDFLGMSDKSTKMKSKI